MLHRSLLHPRAMWPALLLALALALAGWSRPQPAALQGGAATAASLVARGRGAALAALPAGADSPIVHVVQAARPGVLQVTNEQAAQQGQVGSGQLVPAGAGTG